MNPQVRDRWQWSNAEAVAVASTSKKSKEDTVTAETVALPNVVPSGKGSPQIFFMKVDTEGHEVRVFASARPLLQAGR